MSFKKAYNKPIIEIERFIMDIEIANDNFMNDIWWEMFYEANGYYPTSDKEFQDWASQQPGYDNSSSGTCYFTSTNVS